MRETTTSRHRALHMPSSPELSIIVPAFNEARRLARTLPRIVAYGTSRGAPFEVIVVDDGSSDDTLQFTRDFASEHVRAEALPTNRGKGAAVRAGILASRGAKVLSSDADLSKPIEDVERLETHLGDVAVAVGSRRLAGAEILEEQPAYRRVMGAMFRWLVQSAGVRGIRDTQCGFKLLRGDVARDVFQDMLTDGFAFDVELIWLARKRGHTVREVAVRWSDDRASRVRVWIDPAKMFFEVLAFRWKHWRRDRTA